MPKLKIKKGKTPQKKEASQKESATPEEEKKQRGALPEDIDFRRGMGCG